MSSSSIPSYLQDVPALEPPPGITSNLAHPEDKGYVLIIVCSILLFLMILCFSARVYVRFTSRTYVWGDVTCLFAIIFAIAYYIASIIGVVKGPVGKHQWDVTIGDVTSDDFIIAVAFLSNVLFSPTLLLTKLTLFALYLELFHPFKWLKICVYIGIITTSIFYLATGTLMTVWSSPSHGQTWQTHLFTMEQQYAQIYASPFAAVGLAIDLYLLVLPLKAVYDLYLPLKRKFEVGVVFLTGIFACIASTLSVYYRFINKQSNTKDTTWSLQNVIISSLAEMFIGVIVSCMPATWNFLRHNHQFLALKSYSLKISFRSPKLGSKTSTSSTNESKITRLDTPAKSLSERVHVDSLHGKEYNNSKIKTSSSPSKEYKKEKKIPQMKLELESFRSVETYIRSDGKMNYVRDDRIHLQRDIWQTGHI